MLTQELGTATSATHRQVLPTGVCSDHAAPTVWPCASAIELLVQRYGTGWVLAAHLWDQFEEAARLYPTLGVLYLRDLVISRPLDAVQKWLNEDRRPGRRREAA
ncbi:hypothetical protein [Actinoplanes siamensis]|uniref:Uncharacterized protein n=1 Tax=Actinoplanes siamensis TaxID=1223317 RepID=A0A919ND62_9ACTN|nr:hypothetical protein [Actinoplanes siamensis]GIF08549.1 hypothetical protein Asi03nite_60870 [Actinoplanes siamensis]